MSDLHNESGGSPLRQGAQELIAKWRAKAASVDTFHATMGIGWKICADELDALLAAAGSPPQPQADIDSECQCRRCVVLRDAVAADLRQGVTSDRLASGVIAPAPNDGERPSPDSQLAAAGSPPSPERESHDSSFLVAHDEIHVHPNPGTARQTPEIPD